MAQSRTERDRPHWSGVLGLMLLILLILWLTGNLKPAPPLIAPGLDFNQSQPATRRWLTTARVAPERSARSWSTRHAAR